MSAKAAWPWRDLGLDGPATSREVKAAYARRLKEIDRNNPDEFQPLHQAFDRARKLARSIEKAAEARAPRPSMRSVIETQTAAPAPADMPPAKAERPAPQDAPQDAPIHTPEPGERPTPPQAKASEKAQPAPAPEPLPEPPTEPDAPPKPPASLPWGAKVDDLDKLYESDPIKARQEALKRANAALVWPVDAALLGRVLALDLFRREPAVKQGIERRLFALIGDSTPDYSTPMPKDLSNLIEEHFHWSSDGVGLSRKFGMHPDFRKVIHAFTMSRPMHGTSSLDLEKRPYRLMKLGLFALLCLIGYAANQTEISANELPAFIVVEAIVFFFLWHGLPLVLALPLLLLGKTGLYSKLEHSFARTLPDLAADLRRSARYRNIWRWALTAGAMALLELLA